MVFEEPSIPASSVEIMSHFDDFKGYILFLRLRRGLIIFISEMNNLCLEPHSATLNALMLFSRSFISWLKMKKSMRKRKFRFAVFRVVLRSNHIVPLLITSNHCEQLKIVFYQQ